MSILRSTTTYMKFVVEGSFDLYTVRMDGTRLLIFHCDGYGFLGDLEFCGKTEQNRYQEVTERTRTIELPLKPLRPILQEDNRFLRFLLENLSDKLSSTLPSGEEFTNLSDAFVYYLRYKCADHTITNIEETAYRLNYSRRQLHRVLKNLTEMGIVEHTKKGCYRLIPMDSNKVTQKIDISLK